LRSPVLGQPIWPGAQGCPLSAGQVSKGTSTLFNQFNVHVNFTAVTEGEINARSAARGKRDVRFAKRIALQARRQQTRDLGL
jgi:hypothetical protein